jgi:hypothetical protein
VANSTPDSKPATQSGAFRPSVPASFIRRASIVTASLFIITCLIVTAALSHPRVSRADNKPHGNHSEEGIASPVRLGKSGPWGQLQYTHIMLDMPDEYVQLPPTDQPPVRWFFQDYSKDRVIELLKTAEISQDQIDKWLPAAAWKSEINGTWLTPGDDLILALGIEGRSKIYSILIAFAENANQMDPVWFQPAEIDKQFNESGLTQASIKIFKSLLYRNGSRLLLFVDKDTALRQIPDVREKRLFVKTVYSKPTLVARLKINADSDVESLAAYWGMGGRRKDVLPLINALRRTDGGRYLDIVYLLPNFICERLYKHPTPAADSQAPKQDCFWTSMNAFNSKIDDRFKDLNYVRDTLLKDYYVISQPSQLGDLVFLTDADKQAMHAAVYIADDIVFTKNGSHHTQPWILMHMQDMVETYAARLSPGKQLNVIYRRQKSF